MNSVGPHSNPVREVGTVSLYFTEDTAGEPGQDSSRATRVLNCGRLWHKRRGQQPLSKPEEIQFKSQGSGIQLEVGALGLVQAGPHLRVRRAKVADVACAFPKSFWSPYFCPGSRAALFSPPQHKKQQHRRSLQPGYL